ncbi:basic helix-loop-helix family protein [Arabidopsis lyrata subsp. lyrata]|uniref:Basic helix-loop-helix family protein n=1 Tax=Arabidopsis lyrata subsp. lyrata TaxID=81972 RepID=D7L392_ARALL|nr:basic helix-loop-helix family protein [Arabidopsis lyrata subsp. lyrata]
MYQSIDDDDDLLAALCFDQSNGVVDPYAYIQTNEDNIFQDFGSCGLNLQPQQEQFDSFSGNLEQVCSFRGENNGVVYSSSIGSAQLDWAASFSGVLQQETHQVCGFRGQNDDSAANHLQQEQGQVCNGVVEINSSSSVGGVKEELEHGLSINRGRNGSCNKPGTKACREKLRREKLNDKFMDLSSVLEPGRTPKTDKSAILNDAIRVVNQLRGEAHELKETNQKLLEEIKNLKAEKNELREEKLVLKADKEKMVQQLKSMAFPSPGFMPSQHPVAFHPNNMPVYSGYGYYPPNMPMWSPLPPADRDTSRDHKNLPPVA